MKKLTTGLLAAAFLFGGAASITHAAPFDWSITHRDSTDSSDVTTNVHPQSIADGARFIPYIEGRTESGGPDSAVYNMLSVGSGINFAGGTLSVTPYSIETTDGHLSDTLTAMNASTTANVSAIASNASAITANTSAINSLPLVQRATVTTDSSGNYTWTFPTAYASTTVPKITATSLDATAGMSNAKITSRSATSVSIHVDKLATILGLLTLSNNSSVPVDIIAVSQ